MIRTGADVATGFTERTQVCVIGSGAGGAVVAGTLAEAGFEVVLLEEGQRVGREAMTQREEQMYPLLYRDGGNQMTADGGVSVLQGRTLGGSTVVNMADVVPIPDEVVEHWRQVHGCTRFSVAEWRDAGAVASRSVGANRIPSDQINRNGQVLLDGAAALGLPAEAFVHNRVGCIGSGYCLIGCAYDAKKSMALTWIPRAIQTGNTLVQTDARVTRLSWLGDTIRAAEGHVVERGSQTLGAPFRVVADHYVLAAGAVHSPAILLASKLGGPNVGRNLSLQPQAPVSGRMPDRVDLHRGIPQAVYVDQEERSAELGLRGFRIESVSAAPGMAAATSTAWGDAIEDFLAGFQRLSASLALVPDVPSGHVSLQANGRPKIHYTWTPEWTERLRAAVKTAAQVYLAAGADEVYLPFVGAPVIRTATELEGLDRFAIRPSSLPLISAHPQGTCRMNDVLDERFFVQGVKNLQVLDASVFPTTSSSHTMIPVMQAALLGARDAEDALRG